MANHCYNLFSFYGNAKVLKQVVEWQKALDAITPTEEDQYCMRAIRAVFYSNAKPEDEIDFGSKWVHQDQSALSPDETQLGFQSAWGGPDELQKHITILLSELDKHVVIENSFNIEDGSEGYVYTTPNGGGGAYIQTAHAECDYESFDESEDAEAEMMEDLKAQQLEILDYLMDDIPGSAKVIKKHMPNLEVNWADYK